MCNKQSKCMHIYILFSYEKCLRHIPITLPENALTTNVNVAGNLKGWSAAMANKSSPVKKNARYE